MRNRHKNANRIHKSLLLNNMRQRCRSSPLGLKARQGRRLPPFPWKGDDEFISARGLALPAALVQVQDASGLPLELGVAGENPTAVLPGADGVLVQPTPNGRAADVRHQATRDDFPGQVLATAAGQGQAGLGRAVHRPEP